MDSHNTMLSVWEQNLYHRGRRESFREGKGHAKQGLEG